MNPLESLLVIYKDKQKVLDHYLPKSTTDQLHNTIYYDKNDMLLYLNDSIICIKKSTGKKTDVGKIICIEKDKITLKKSSTNITINENDYFIFIKQKKKKNKDNNREFFKELLKQLN